MPQMLDGNYSQHEAVASMTEEVLDATIVWQAGGDEVEAPRWKGKGKEVATPSTILYALASSSGYSLVENEIEEESEEVDWKQYGPPQALTNVQDIESEVITQIVHESINRIKARITEEEEQRQTAIETARILDAELSEKEVVAILPEKPEDLQENQNDDKEVTQDGKQPRVPTYYRMEPPQTATFAGVKFTMDANGLLRPVKSQPKSKRRNILGGILRRFNNRERGESGVQAAARHKHRLSVDYNALASKGIQVVDNLVDGSTKSPRTSVHENLVECVSCFEEFNPNKMVKCPCHSYCTACFHRLIETACENEQQWPPKCCLNIIPKSTILSGTFNYHALQKVYNDKSEEWSIPISERIYCYEPVCAGIFVRPAYINHAENVARCEAGHYICTLCRGQRHVNQACPQDRDLQRTEELADEEGWKRCYQCHAFVEHREACQHMTCRCGAEFCYVCGARWRTCACSMQQLHAVKSEAATRRRIRRSREAQEEAELAEALRLVEEYEREEARKATLLRLERERIEKERRKKELDKRLLVEVGRRKGVELQFRNLTQVLNDLHEEQRVEVVREHGKYESVLRYKAESSITALKEQNDRKRDLLVNLGIDKIQEFRSAMDQEHAARADQERQVEEQYYQQLTVYWAGKPDGNLHAEAAVLSLKRRMDKGYQVWNRWMQNEIDKHRFLVEEEQSVQLEMMDEAERRLKQDLTRHRQAFAKRKAAEFKWVELVIQERELMLIEMRFDEMEGGDDMDALLAETQQLNLGEASVSVNSSQRDSIDSSETDNDRWYEVGDELGNLNTGDTGDDLDDLASRVGESIRDKNIYSVAVGGP
ncbi:hypothetical protein BKA67DRAFT_48536 [Truncatella angustata]|uniref:RBR-type E3 ubiquitin transferase n=1 Tax=Truncatella angustata TaxID=152316 RepID=A0A9P8UY58_9PEZI|nr:uncharacterized protein BKA67DRAFT_48536 [Truncatella angustata]KAH6660338.1 hypothetical protein BKA67DRAFT_48536 [Truncatella angustata]